MSDRARQLTSLWLALVLVLLPVSGNLLAAVSQHTGPQGAAAPHGHPLHHGQMDHGQMDHGQMDHGQMDHGAHHADHHRHSKDTSGTEQAPTGAAAHAHDCHNSLCAGGCGGCAGCHAPPSGASGHPTGASTLSITLPRLASTPPPDVFDRPPQALAA